MRDGSDQKPYVDNNAADLDFTKGNYIITGLQVPNDGFPFELDDITVYAKCKCCGTMVYSTLDDWIANKKPHIMQNQ